MYNTDYELLVKEAVAITDGVDHFIANLANLSSLIYTTLEDVNWAGFYLCENDMLVLGPFQGNPACIEIPFGKGVCGTAVSEDASQLVKNVHEFPGHIACDCASNSEIVIPIRKDSKIVGVLDIDSPTLERFDEKDLSGLEKLVEKIEEYVF